MNDEDFSTIGSDSDKSNNERPKMKLAAETETIDLTEVLTKDLTASGSYFIEGFQDTFFGKLLEALPVAGLLIDKSFTIRFANQSWGRFSSDFL
jgi:hypothetical protein